MEDLIGFMEMAGTYEQRKVARYDDETLLVDTASVTDGAQLFETAVRHPQYNGGEMVIVEAYDTHEEAEAGHEYWVVKMTTEPLPDALTDCANAGIGSLLEAIGGVQVFSRQE